MFLGDTNLGRLILDSIVNDNGSTKTASKKFDAVEAGKISEGLSKVASYPYKEESYASMQEMMKIASDCISDAIDTIKSIQDQNADLQKVAEVRIILDDMIDSGMVSDSDVEEKIAELAAKDGRELEIVKEAVKLSKSGREGNSFFEIDKTASVAISERRGMFDGVIDE